MHIFICCTSTSDLLLVSLSVAGRYNTVQGIIERALISTITGADQVGAGQLALVRGITLDLLTL